MTDVSGMYHVNTVYTTAVEKVRLILRLPHEITTHTFYLVPPHNVLYSMYLIWGVWYLTS